MLGQVVPGVEHLLAAPKGLDEEPRVADLDLAQPVPPALLAAQVQHGAAPRLAIQLEEALGAERRLPQQVVHVELRPFPGAQLRLHLREVGGTGQRRQDREADLPQALLRDERPQALELVLAPRGIDDEVAGDAEADLAGDANALPHPLDGRVLAQPGQAVVGRRFEAEEHVELARERTPGLEQRGLSGHRVDAALHEHPLLAQAAPDQLGRQRLAARAMVPEQVVGDEDVIADGRRVAADGLDAALAELAVVHLPDGTERAPERTAARRFDEERRPVREAGVLPAPALDMAAGRDGHHVERDARPRIRGAHEAVGRPDHEPGDIRQGAAALDRLDGGRHGALAIVQHDHVDGRVGEGLRERGGRMSAQHQGGLGRETAHLLDQARARRRSRARACRRRRRPAAGRR